MKHKPMAYAKALAEVLHQNKAISPAMVERNFLSLLQKNGDLKKAGQILALAESLYLKKTGNKKIVVEMARPMNVKSLMEVIVRPHDKVEEKIRPELIAGARIIVDGSRQLDVSLARKLEEIFR